VVKVSLLASEVVDIRRYSCVFEIGSRRERNEQRAAGDGEVNSAGVSKRKGDELYRQGPTFCRR
jgi:hypothetical protein